MLQFLGRTYNTLKSHVKTHSSDIANHENMAELLGLFFNQKASRHTLLTSTIHTSLGKPRAGEITTMGDISRIEEVQVQRGHNDKKIRIGRQYLIEWLNKRNQNTTSFINMLVKRYGAVISFSTLGAGTSMATGQMRVIDLDISKSDPSKQGE